MMDRIKAHNILNGIIFSIVEFVITAAILAPFAIYYALHARWLYAAVAIGIILNCSYPSRRLSGCYMSCCSSVSTTRNEVIQNTVLRNSRGRGRRGCRS